MPNLAYWFSMNFVGLYHKVSQTVVKNYGIANAIQIQTKRENIMMKLSTLLITGVLGLTVVNDASATCYGEMAGATGGATAGIQYGIPAGAVVGAEVAGVLCATGVLLSVFTFGASAAIGCGAAVAIGAGTGAVVGGATGGAVGATTGAAIGRTLVDKEGCENR